MTADARRDDDALLRHGLERLEWGHQLGQAGRNAREYEQVDQVVIPPHLLVRNASGKNDVFTKTELGRQSTQPLLFRPAADQQCRDICPLTPHLGDCAQQQIQTLIGIERAEEAKNDLPGKPEPTCESGVGNSRSGEFIAVDGIGNDRHLVGGDTAGDRIRPQALADRCHRIRAMERAGLDDPGHQIPQAGLTMSPVTRRRVLPKGAYFINNRDRMSPAGPNCRPRVEDRGVGVQYLRANLADHFVEFPVEIADDRQLANPRQPGVEPGRHPGPQKFPFTDALARRSRRVMLAAGQQHRLPA